MTVESAEMTKHAVNAFLATSVAFINELSRICHQVGADVKQVERGLKTEGRIGPKAYLSPGAAFAGGTLARDVRYLLGYGEERGVDTSFFQGLWRSNEAHKNWVREQTAQMLRGIEQPIVAVLGLTYKPGTNTLRRSTSLELCRWLLDQNIRVQAHDPAFDSPPAEIDPAIAFHPTVERALANADLAVIATPWPEYRDLNLASFAMRHSRVLDPMHVLRRAG
jgi:UDPglucose 6-dehydrogenase